MNAQENRTNSSLPAGCENPPAGLAVGGMADSWMAQCRPGWSLPGAFYSEEQIYRADLQRIWRAGWLLAGHACEVPNPGDFFTLEVDTDSLIILRDDEGTIRCLHNVCRHRGSLICTSAGGQVRRLVCPYHQWTYGLDGALLACRGMPEDLDKSHFGLRSAQALELEGLIFISLAAPPPDFELFRGTVGPLLRPQGLARARVAHTADYLVRANWKLVWENNRECYHCNQNHPQYIRANFDHFNADDTSPLIQAQIAGAVRRHEEKWAATGLGVTRPQAGMTEFPDAENKVWFSANRTALVDGYVSETLDGMRVAPLMGDYREEDVGTLRMRTLPNFWNHSSCDHSVSTRLLPVGPQLTAVRVWWLVEAGAVPGRDYQLDKMLPFWQLTSEQDWEICERQQRGVISSAYTPGPYSTHKEYNVDSFVRWYLRMLAET